MKFFSHIHAHRIRTKIWNGISVSLPHHTKWIDYKLRLFSASLSWPSLSFLYNFTSHSLYSFSIAFHSFFIWRIHVFFSPLFYFFIALWILLYSIFRRFFSTMSCRSLTVECSLATIFGKVWERAYFFCFAHHSFSTFSMPILFHIPNTNTFRENCIVRIHSNFDYTPS